MSVVQARWKAIVYFFLYPVGHFGFALVTFLVIFPLTQTIEINFVGFTTVATGADGLGVGEGVAAETVLSALMRILGAEKWKPLAKKFREPSLFITAVVATLLVPSSFTISRVSFAALVRVFPGYLQSIKSWLAQYLKYPKFNSPDFLKCGAKIENIRDSLAESQIGSPVSLVL